MPPSAATLQPSTVADLLEKYRLAGGDPDRFIVVGGGASLHWTLAIAADAGPDESELSTREAPLRTRDIDFQVDRLNDEPDPYAAIEQFARSVDGRVVRPDAAHATPELAHVLIPDYFAPDEPLIIDFLPDVLGLTAADGGEFWPCPLRCSP